MMPPLSNVQRVGGERAVGVLERQRARTTDRDIDLPAIGLGHRAGDRARAGGADIVNVS